MQSIARQRGLSLIELMIGILLSSLLLLGVLQIFQSNSQTMRTQTAFSRVQESGRFAIDLLTKEIRSADYWGCAPDQASIVNQLNVATGFFTTIGADGVQGVNDATSATVDSKSVIDGTDILILGGTVDACGGAGRMVNPAAVGQLQVSTNCAVDPGDVVLVSNCQAGDVMTVTAVSGTLGDGSDRTISHNTGTVPTGWIQNASSTLAQGYGADSKILRPYQRTYFIAASETGTNSLFMSDEGGNTQELVPGIEDMQVFYGRDTTGSGVVDLWQTANSNLVDMAEVTAIKVQLIVASDGNASTGSQTITELDGTETTYSDGRLRKLYVATVKVRNRGSM